MTKKSGKPSKRRAQKPEEKIAKTNEELSRAKKKLQEAEACWEDDGFIEALKKKTPEEQEEAFRLKLEIERKILMIENAQIASVASRVQESSQELESAMGDLGESLQTLSNVTRILNAAGSVLSIVGRILAL